MAIGDIKKMYDKCVKNGAQFCRICGKEIYKYDLADVTGIETKSTKNTIVIHNKCIIDECRRNGGNPKKLVFTEVIYKDAEKG